MQLPKRNSVTTYPPWERNDRYAIAQEKQCDYLPALGKKRQICNCPRETIQSAEVAAGWV
ncbi:hypothetical protein MAR_019651 [Mya arenaria]|uniref:Uncharacterized protein n=1 Tax=Mya arenaria TaxID=6604 RepID=A0ABY7E2P3_MYAAR|nr:hypothetical protein MAR_019651 [Mya arenaria]